MSVFAWPLRFSPTTRKGDLWTCSILSVCRVVGVGSAPRLLPPTTCFVGGLCRGCASSNLDQPNNTPIKMMGNPMPRTSPNPTNKQQAADRDRKYAMNTKTPRTIREYREYLQDAFDTLKSDHASDFFDQMQIADQVEEASVLACRFGAGHLIETKHHVLTPREALVLVGRLLAWVEKEVRSPTLDVHEMASLLGCTERTVWRHRSQGADSGSPAGGQSGPVGPR